MLDEDRPNTHGHDRGDQPLIKVGFGHPPVHSRFQPGKSGNPSGRAKGSRNLRTLFQAILKEQVSVREGTRVRKVTKREAILRGLIVTALKGDAKSIATLFRLAEQTGELEQQSGSGEITEIRRIIVGWQNVPAAE